MTASAFLPDPLVPPEVDIRNLPSFVLNTERLMASELWALSSGDEFKAAVALWCRAWKQTPAASLPSDERVLASWAGVPFVRWKRLRAMAMRGFVLCSDDRYYHRTLADAALYAWDRKKQFQARSAKANAVRWGSNGDASSIQQASNKDATGILNRPKGKERNINRGPSQGQTSVFQDRARGPGADANGQAQVWDDDAPFGGEASR